MNTITGVIQIAAGVAGGLVICISLLLFLRLRWPAPVLWLLKLFSSALSVWLAGTAALVLVAGLFTRSLALTGAGVYGLVVFCVHIFRVLQPPATASGFNKAFGPQWHSSIQRKGRRYLLPRRFVFTLPAVPEPRIEQNMCFAEIPGSGRELLCDLWQPHPEIKSSGITFIYLHGSAFYFLDKDFATRPFFRQLAAQGHLIMDVAYRLAPETGILGMVQDVNRAILWMKEHAFRYGADPANIVLGGGSAGAHLALLAAYTSGDPAFAAPGLTGKDTSVRGVVSLYGPTNLAALFYHTGQHLAARNLKGRPTKKVPAKLPEWLIKKMGSEYHRLGMDKDFESTGALAPLLWGTPDEVPDAYAFFSPVNHIHPQCPPTLLVHGEHDLMAPVKTTRAMYAKLAEKGVLTVLHTLPQTDHAFDLVLPRISPAAHNALYDVEMFLEMMSARAAQKKYNSSQPVARNLQP